jgi:hypothetical protein
LVCILYCVSDFGGFTGFSFREVSHIPTFGIDYLDISWVL